MGIFAINPMEWRMIDRLAGVPEGTYQDRPVETYRAMQVRSGVTAVDQWIPGNPLTMGAQGFDESVERTVTTGAGKTVLDGIVIDSPESAVEHLERFAFPAIEKAIAEFDEEACTRTILSEEARITEEVGDEMLKAPYHDPFARFPYLGYGTYGYENYFAAYALYGDVMERHFRLQADYAVLYNRAAARAIREGGLPPYIRLDHDMTDSRGPLPGVESLERIWFGHFERSIRPFVEAGITLVWHSDGNVMPMVPGLIECGVKGFQGFQYEDGVDYRKICGMKAHDGAELLIIAGVSVTRTLPYGTPEDVREEMKFLVENGPRRGLFLGASSSITPGVPWENLKALVEGFRHYRTRGRG